jgi:5'-3' exonuclease
MNIIIDCNYIAYTCRFALSEGLTYRGNRTEIIFGFLKEILSLSEHFNSDDFFFCWDSRESERKKLYPSYKANRRPDDRPQEEKELDAIAYKQFDEIRTKVLPDLGFKNIYMLEGYESDDLMAILSKQLPGPNIVVSNDKDMYQILSYCSLYSVSKKQLTTKVEFERTFKIKPEEWAEVKALAGCSGDNVEGIPGVGEKTAIKYLKGELNKGKVFTKIEESKDIIDRNRVLVSLPFKDMPLPVYKKNRLLARTFLGVFSTYGLLSMSQGILWSKWTKFFNLK